MAQYHNEKSGLIIGEKYCNTLDIQGFAQMMKDPSYCYKFYWLEAIVNLISLEVRETIFDAVIDEMITNAWYSVREFHIHLSGIPADGVVRDGLERAVLQLTKLTNLPANASKIEIKNAIKDHNQELKQVKGQLTHMVPYRALAGFFTKADESIQWGNKHLMTEYIQKIHQNVNLLPYTLGEGSGLNKEIYFNPEWMAMIQDYTVNILGWIQYEKVKWLQNNNPEVPGLVYKLAPMDKKMRNLKNVQKLWESVIESCEIRDVFTGKPVVPKTYDIDHFIPWSFVMHDELWNLMPMDSGLNSAKNNRLPEWDLFFESFSQNQYKMYSLVHEKSEIHRRFEACYRNNLHSIWAGQELYRRGNSQEEFHKILQKNMQPVYDSARRQGYEIWKYRRG